jgi:AbrB family transcriptional regulator (stage V sporulation protein T)
LKETGMLRRIDELGRIVIPKEIRKNLKIREGDQLEFYVEKEYVVLRKKSSLHGLNEDIIHLLEILNDKLKKDIILTDLDKVIYSLNNKEYKNLDLSSRYKNILHKRKIYDGNILDFIIGYTYNKEIYSYPLISYGELYGSLIILQDKEYLLDNEKEIIKIIGDYIIKKLEY